MILDTTSRNWREKKIREWLLLLLRFAITRAEEDRVTSQNFAEELDTFGASRNPSSPRFFQRTNREICDAIQAIETPEHAAILRTHIARIAEPRLRHAFSAAIGLEERELQPLLHHSRRKAPDLWKGLPG